MLNLSKQKQVWSLIQTKNVSNLKPKFLYFAYQIKGNTETANQSEVYHTCICS